MVSRSRQLMWVLGGQGFLGRRIATHYSKEGWDVAGIGRHHALTTDVHPFAAWIPKEIEPATIDELVRTTGRPEIIFHAAGAPSVSAAQLDPQQADRDTVETVRTVLRFIRDISPETIFLYPSSCAVYGSAAELPQPETSPLNPVSRYGEMKQLIEATCEEAHGTSGIRCGVIRYFSVYGSGLRKQLLWDIAVQARESSDVRLSGSGAETRDFFCVEDAAQLAIAVGKAIIRGEASYIVVNGGTGQATSVSDAAELMLANLPGKASLNFSGIARPGDPEHYMADLARARELGFTSFTTPEDGIPEYARWAGAQLWP